MKLVLMLGTLSTISSFELLAQEHENPDPLLGSVVLEQLERRTSSADESTNLEGYGWFGHDLHKLWIKTDVEINRGSVEEAEIQALYSRAVSAFWDVQMGMRVDLEPSPSRTWGVFGVKGLAPYFYDIDAALFVSDGGDLAARLSAEYEVMLTQKWVLSPELTVDFAAQNDQRSAQGSGVSATQVGLRLRYEIRREFAPYVGINWHRKFGRTADFARILGNDVDDTQWVLGLRAWF